MLPSEVVEKIRVCLGKHPRMKPENVAKLLGMKTASGKKWSVRLIKAIREDKIADDNLKRLDGRFKIGARSGKAIKKDRPSIKLPIPIIDDLVRFALEWK